MTLFGVPHGSMLRAVLFKAYVSDPFYDIDYLDFASFADNHTSVLGRLKGGIDKYLIGLQNIFLKEPQTISIC